MYELYPYLCFESVNLDDGDMASAVSPFLFQQLIILMLGQKTSNDTSPQKLSPNPKNEDQGIYKKAS